MKCVHTKFRGKIIQVTHRRPWVRCTSGNVSFCTFPSEECYLSVRYMWPYEREAGVLRASWPSGATCLSQYDYVVPCTRLVSDTRECQKRLGMQPVLPKTGSVISTSTILHLLPGVLDSTLHPAEPDLIEPTEVIATPCPTGE